MASTAGKWGSLNQCAYNASKHGVVGITRCLGLEMAPYNINVNAICPALVETDLVTASTIVRAKMQNVSPEELAKTRLKGMPLGRIIKPQEVARLALYLASDECLNMTCQSISLCGGHIMV
jgi:NAD(P)-dependent dehydrogenase (short-subunit alcohol dehydrogenase family)